MTEHTDQAAPRFELLFTQGAREVGDDHQLVRTAAFAKQASADAPARRSARKHTLLGALRVAFQVWREAQQLG